MITAKVIADSVSQSGKRITTMELEYPRFIHSEFLTHRVFSRNAASSRAIPVAKVLEQVRNNPAMPIHWGKNQPGMQAAVEHDAPVLYHYPFSDDDDQDCTIQEAWAIAANHAANMAEAMSAAGYHKQVVNRILEPFVHIKVIVTATEWDNFFLLRAHPDAQPEIHELALQMRKAMDESVPVLLNYGEWHLPYIKRRRDINGVISYSIPGEVGSTSFEDAIKVSASCCAQVSYRKLDDSLEKAKMVYDRLVTSEPVHASPFEHQATPATGDNNRLTGNFVGWVQNRKIIEI